MISVALCTYNGERYIREQIESILNQTLPVDEIVVCDDGSTDNTLSFIENFQGNTDIRIYRNETNLGVCANFQKAVDLCRGEYIFFSDQDDIWHTDKTATIIDYFLSNPEKKVVFTDANLINEQNDPICDTTLWNCFGITEKKLRLIDKGFGVELFAYENRATGATMALHRDFQYTHSFIKYCVNDILHDGALAMLAVSANQLGYINKCLIDYRIHGNQECGIGMYLKKPLDNSIKDVRFTNWSLLQLPSYLGERISFIMQRQRQQHQPLGPLRMFCSTGIYCKLYRHQWLAFLFFDIKQWACIMWRRIFK